MPLAYLAGKTAERNGQIIGEGYAYEYKGKIVTAIRRQLIGYTPANHPGEEKEHERRYENAGYLEEKLQAIAYGDQEIALKERYRFDSVHSSMSYQSFKYFFKVGFIAGAGVDFDSTGYEMLQKMRDILFFCF